VSVPNAQARSTRSSVSICGFILFSLTESDREGWYTSRALPLAVREGHLRLCWYGIVKYSWTRRSEHRSNTTSKCRKATFKEVGAGVLDFPAILRSAEAVGVEHSFVEQDQTPGDQIDSIRKSYELLRNLKV
jgi:hypothetical protein